MNLMETLKSVKDMREDSKACAFNGYLEDYLNVEGCKCHEVLEAIMAIDPECRIMTDYSVFMNPQLSSNKVISYKDILKVPKWYIKAPIILYSQSGDASFALVLYHQSYLEAKGLYYLMTENGAVFESHRNSVVCLPMRDVETIVSVYTMMMEKPLQAQMFQREQDRRHFRDVDSLELIAINLGQKHVKEVQESFETMPASRAQRIYNSIVSWYLLKKMVYVQIMTDKEVLTKQCRNSVKEQRRIAKEMSSKIDFIAFRDMWRQ